MELLQLRVPWDFFYDRLNITWQDILFGINNELFDAHETIDVATQILANGNEDSDILELASLSHEDSVMEFVKILAEKEQKQEEMIKRKKWLYIVLSWVFENKDNYEDPLDFVETIYTEFDYPEEIKGFVRYMPADEEVSTDIKANENRLFVKWKEYLDNFSSTDPSYS